MDWVCTDCERTYAEVPERCEVCGNDALVPAEEADPSHSGLPGLGTLLDNARAVVTDPGRVDRSLVRPNSTVDLAFRLLLAASLVVGVVLLVGLLV